MTGSSATSTLAPGDRRLAGMTPGQWTLVACGVHLLAGLLLYEPALFPGGDNAGYMILGESLRSGEGYRDLYLPDTPIHTKYPPLYPAVLAVLGWIGDLQLYKLASLGFTTTAVALTAALGREVGVAGSGGAGRGSAPTGRGADRAHDRSGGAAAEPVTWAAVAAALLFAANPVLLDYSHYVLSEAPFVCLVLLSLYLYGRGDRWWPLGLAAAAAAFLTRTAGLPLLLAAVLYPALRKRWRRTAAALAVTAVAAGGWALFQRLGAPGEAGYLAELVLVNPYEPEAGTVGAAGMLQRSVVNLWEYMTWVLPAALIDAEQVPGAGTPPRTLLLGIAVTLLAAIGWFRQSIREIRHAELFTVLYAGLILLWPSVWNDQRFLLPVLPLLLFYAFSGAMLAGAWVTERAPSTGDPGDGAAGGREHAGSGRSLSGREGHGALAALALFTLLLAVPAMLSATRAAPERLRCLASYRAGDPCISPPLASFLAAAEWARDNTPPEAIVVSRKPRFFYYASGRRGDLYRYTGEAELLIADLEQLGADYVVVDRISGTTARYLIPAVELHAHRFRVEYREGTPSTWILRFLPLPATTLRAP